MGDDVTQATVTVRMCADSFDNILGERHMPVVPRTGDYMHFTAGMFQVDAVYWNFSPHVACDVVLLLVSADEVPAIALN